MTAEAAITRLHERKVYENAFVAVFDDDVRFSDGSPGRYVRLVEAGGKPGVTAIAACGDRVALVRTYRYTLQRFEWGIPRGFGQYDDPELSMLAELTEELGEPPERLQALTSMAPNSGLLATSVNMFLASYSRMPSTPKDRLEVSEVRWVTWPVLLSEIAAGHLTDGFTLAAVGVAASRGLIPR